MGPKVKIERATADHAAQLAPLMRTADAEEVLASGGYSPLEALLESLDGANPAFAVSFDGEVAAICGVTPMDNSSTLLAGPAVGIVWAMTGRAVEKHPLAFLKLCRPMVALFRQRYPVLVNAVDARYRTAIRWVEWLGFQVDAAAMPFGAAGLPFHLIYLGGTPNV